VAILTWAKSLDLNNPVGADTTQTLNPLKLFTKASLVSRLSGSVIGHPVGLSILVVKTLPLSIGVDLIGGPFHVGSYILAFIPSFPSTLIPPIQPLHLLPSLFSTSYVYFI
jgi:hypothetical protein